MAATMSNFRGNRSRGSTRRPRFEWEPTVKLGAETAPEDDDVGDTSPGPPGDDHRAGGLRVLFANAPLAYRQAMAMAIGRLRPEIEVLLADPEALDLEVERFRPDMVVCSHVTALVECRVPAWVDLYPDGERMATIGIEGRRTKTAGIELDDLLAIVDQRAGDRATRRG